jgi:phospholipid/cholesterol/gamma-HCH transport system substrate-binding protein
MTRLRSALRSALTVLATLLVLPMLTACDFDVYSLPLPGGTDTGDDPITVTVKFRDVLDLVPQSTVKVNDVSVGKVTDVRLDGAVAEVTLELRNDVELPDNTFAELRQTSLLGEKFVSIGAPESGAGAGRLEDGDVIPLERSGRNPEVEEVLGALSLLLNGGGVGQLKTISSEINKALEGREGSAKSVLTQVRVLMQQLDENKADIIDAIEALNRLSIEAGEHLDTIDAALDELPSALDSLDAQRGDLVKMLKALDDLSGVGVRVIRASKAATIDSLQQLDPVLTQLAAAGDDFANAFHVFLTYPFVDEVVGRDPQVARNLHMGDYTNLSIQLEIDLSDLLPSLPSLPPLPSLPTALPTVPLPSLPTPTLLPTELDPTKIVDDVLACLASGDLNSEACLKLLSTLQGLLALQEACKKPENQNSTVCQQLALIPDLPNPTDPTLSVSPLPTLPLPSISIPTIPGVGRAPMGAVDTYGARGPTWGQLMERFDPDLVSLMVPGLVPSEPQGSDDR